MMKSPVRPSIDWTVKCIADLTLVVTPSGTGWVATVARNGEPLARCRVDTDDEARTIAVRIATEMLDTRAATSAAHVQEEIAP